MLSPLVGLFFCKRHILACMMKKSGTTSLKENYFSHTVKVILAESQELGELGFIGSRSFEVSNKKQDESSRSLIVDVKPSDNDLLLIDIYNANKESE